MVTGPLDPVDIAAEALRPLTVFAYPSHEHVTEMAHTALEALHAAGWRIVQTSTCQCGDPDIEHGDGVHRLDAYPCEERIVKEWPPGVSSVTEAPPAPEMASDTDWSFHATPDERLRAHAERLANDPEVVATVAEIERCLAAGEPLDDLLGPGVDAGEFRRRYLSTPLVEDPAGAEATAGLPPEQLLQLQTQAWQEAEPALCADPSCVCHEEGDDSDAD